MYNIIQSARTRTHTYTHARARAPRSREEPFVAVAGRRFDADNVILYRDDDIIMYTRFSGGQDEGVAVVRIQLRDSMLYYIMRRPGSETIITAAAYPLQSFKVYSSIKVYSNILYDSLLYR